MGDGKYDIPIMKKVGLSICPKDAIEEVKRVSDIILKKNGGEGCIAEIYTLLSNVNRYGSGRCDEDVSEILAVRLAEHQEIVNIVRSDKDYIACMQQAADIIINAYKNDRCLFLCGNGGSAADAQHLAAELVGRFYLERRALNAEALTTNTSILTALANDYDYNMIYERQLEAKAMTGDVLIGITTSGTSENILRAFQKAKEMKVKTILMTGSISEYMPIRKDTDCLLTVPSQNIPRIQEIHILTGHIICEIVEKELKRLGRI